MEEGRSCKWDVKYCMAAGKGGREGYGGEIHKWKQTNEDGK